jgi:8-oxo-dGTP pyrophosphatase MutT (NUDIX family)
VRDTSLVYPVRADGSILLGRKRRGMGYGKWNGFGGKIEAGETMRQCACRELLEECGLVMEPEKLVMVGDLYFHQPSDPQWSHAGIVYFARDWKGTPHLSDEMEPRWFRVVDFPYDDMWMADRVWLPMILAGKKIRGTIYFAEDGETVYDYDFREMT